jgi:hypothetical protein
MTGGPHPSSAGGSAGAGNGPAGPQAHAGLGRKGLRGKGLLFSFFFYSYFLFTTSKQNLNSNQDLNPNTQKQCTSMNATLNSYISLIN